ncbi:MAG: hypothetical protein KAY65_14250 [Planctomycetes bacterium]|nr:hypothetical protein [Planctomycetota bacterium]
MTGPAAAARLLGFKTSNLPPSKEGGQGDCGHSNQMDAQKPKAVSSRPRPFIHALLLLEPKHIKTFPAAISSYFCYCSLANAYPKHPASSTSNRYFRRPSVSILLATHQIGSCRHLVRDLKRLRFFFSSSTITKGFNLRNLHISFAQSAQRYMIRAAFKLLL